MPSTRRQPCQTPNCTRTAIGRKTCNTCKARLLRGTPLERYRREPDWERRSCRLVWVDCRCGHTYARRRGYRHCPFHVSRNGRPYGYVPVPPRTIQCVDCGMDASVNHALRVRCDACRDSRKAVERRAYKARRRALKRGVTVETVFRRVVFDRDNWTCQLCRRPLRRDVAAPHPKAATLDHIIPLAAGGEHSYRNVQAAHFICNSRKGAGPAQLSAGLAA